MQRLKRVREMLRTSQNPSAFFAGVGLWHRDVHEWMRKQWKLSIIKSNTLFPDINRDFPFESTLDQSNIEPGFQGRLIFIYIVVRYY